MVVPVNIRSILTKFILKEGHDSYVEKYLVEFIEVGDCD